MANEIAAYLKYANLQMAAESLFAIGPSNVPGATTTTMTVATLAAGNNRTNKFTETQAQQFIEDGWTVVEHKSNTATGFSGTLFKNTNTGELVLSFRSTEFIDDAARDNQATNGMEIRPFGWAFGQIADMQAWVNDLRNRNELDPQKSLTVTGYSLGGHLASAFEMLYPNTANSIYTFNGAGVGQITNGSSLTQVISAFNQRRSVGSNSDLFIDEQVRGLYDAYKDIINDSNGAITVDAIDAALAQANTLARGFPLDSTSYDEALLLAKALQRSRDIAFEAQRVTGLSSGSGNDPVGVVLGGIEAIGLDYQLAVLKTGEMTASYGDANAVAKAAGTASRTTDNQPNIFDIFGDTLPSLVANSQRHLGVSTPIWIEDQPTLRGTVLSAVFDASSLATGVKLLTPGFSTNDFGDTHSLVLLVDSLSVQNTLAQLDTNVKPSTLSGILNSASNDEAETGFTSTVGANNQGKADGNSLEQVVNALGKILGVDAVAGWKKLKGDPNGNTWAITDYQAAGVSNPDGYTTRADLHANLALIAIDPDYKDLIGNVRITASVAGLESSAKTDFGGLVSLLTLSPFVISASNDVGKAQLDELWGSSWADEFSAWTADKNARLNGDITKVFDYSDNWYTDRATLLQAIVKRNQNDITGGIVGDVSFARDRVVEFQYIDPSDATDKTLTLWNPANNAAGNALSTRDRQRIAFGDANANTLTGTDNKLGDHLYGDAGDDFLDGKGGDDYLEGGVGDDAYNFNGLFGKDVVLDREGQGSINVDGQKLNGGSLAGSANQWKGKDGAGVEEIYTVKDDARSSTGKVLVITRGGESTNSITINNFDLAQAQTPSGYLGIQLDPTVKLALTEAGTAPQPGQSSPNFWSRVSAGLADLADKVSNLFEGTGKSYTVSLNQAAKVGDTITLHLALDDAALAKAILGSTTVDANGAVITLAEGQTQVSFALVTQGNINADLSGALSASYQGAGPNAQSATSNSWGINLKDAGPSTNTLNGDYAVASVVSDVKLTRYNAALVPTVVVEQGADRFIVDSQGNLVADANGTLITDNVLFGSVNNDTINGLSGNDALMGGAGNDTIDGGIGDDLIGGGAGNDRILGGDGNDFICSSADGGVALQQLGPNDIWLNWGAPIGKQILASGSTWGVYKDSVGGTAQTLIDGIGQLQTDMQSDTIDAGAGNDDVLASWGDDRVQGGAGDDYLDGLAGNDILEGGDGDDKIQGDGIVQAGFLNSVDSTRHGADFIHGGAGNDTVSGGGNNDNLFGGTGDDTMFGDSAGPTNDASYVSLAFHGNDYMDGEDGDDYLEGGGKDDTLYGGAGSDILWGDTSAENVASAADNTLIWGSDYLNGEDGNDTLIGGGKDDTLIGGAGDDILIGDENNPLLAGADNGNDYLDGGDGNDQLVGGGKDDVLYGGAGNDRLFGDDALANVSAEFQGNDYLDGEEGDDVLVGGGGDDTLFGGAGVDTLQGGDGNDYLSGDEGNDLLFGENGDDTLLGGSGDDELQGGSGANLLDGEDGNDKLFAASDNNSLSGGAGDDMLQVDSGSNNFLDGGEGADTLFARNDGNTMLGGLGDDQIQLVSGSNSTLDGGDGDDILQVTGTDNTLLGGAGDDVLVVIGGTNNFLDGGEGSDAYVLNRGFGTTHISDSGSNSVRFNFAFAGSGMVLGVGSLMLTFANGDVLHIDGFDPNDAANSSSIKSFAFTDTVLSIDQLLAMGAPDINGTPLDDVLDGTPLNERIFGLAGNDVINADAGDDFIDAGEGNDVVNAGFGNDAIVGGAGDDVIDAGVGNDFIDGGSGSNILTGGAGDDTYFLRSDSVNLIVENTSEGVDQVFSDIDYTMNANVENLTLRGVAQTGIGNDSDNIIIGNLGLNSNVLEGGGGNDTLLGNGVLSGGDGDDVLRGNGTLSGGNGNDLLAGSGSLSGGDGNDNLTSGAGDDILDGGAGADLMRGGAGADIYFVDNVGDRVIEDIVGTPIITLDGRVVTTPDIDTVNSSISYTLGSNLENLTLTGVESIDGTGNLIDNVISGNDGDNVLSGGSGNDTLNGGGGSDILLGGDGADILIGGTGADVMNGGAGSDTYFVDNVDDVIVEDVVGTVVTPTYTLNDIEIVNSSVSYTLSANLEQLNLTGSANIDGTGNELANYIVGNDGDNVLSGGAGSDTLVGGGGTNTLIGGAGNELYQVSSANDVIIEDVDGGFDQVSASVDFTLAANVELLYMLEGATSGTGNDGDNTIVGNNADNLLDGRAGADRIDGGAGNDVIAGGSGNDNLFGGHDEATGFGREIFSNSDTIDGGAGDDFVDGGSGNDLLYGGAGNDYLYGGDDDGLNRGDGVGELTNRDSIFGGEGNDVIDGGSDADSLYGGAGDDLIYGGNNFFDNYYDPATGSLVALSNDDFIDGGDGNDQIYGEDDNDVLLGGAGTDIVDGGSGDDVLYSSHYGDALSLSGGDNGANFPPAIPLLVTANLDDGSIPLANQLELSKSYLLEGFVGDGPSTYSIGLPDIGLGYDYDFYSLGQLLPGENIRAITSSGFDNIIGVYNSDGQLLAFNSGSASSINGVDSDISYTVTQGDFYYFAISDTRNSLPTNPFDANSGGDVFSHLWVGGSYSVLLNLTDPVKFNINPAYLDAAVSRDTMSGGTGNDTYVVDGTYTKVAYTVYDDCGDPIPAERLVWTTDTVLEMAGEGYDTVVSSGSFVLSDNVEALQLAFDPKTAKTDPQYYADLIKYGQDGTGNDLNNIITGNQLDNRLDGGLGNDTLEGGLGNDTYVIDSYSDVVVELADGGIDTVESNLSFALDDPNLENLTLLGDAEFGFGNSADNVLIGNEFNNELDGFDGNDKLVGGAGDDWLYGGSGNDRYVFQLDDGADVIDDWQGGDTLFFGSDLTKADITVVRSVDDLVLSVNNTTDSITVRNWFVQAEGISRIEFCNASALDRAGIEALVNGTSTEAPPVANDDAIGTDEDSAATVISVPDLLANDVDNIAGDSLTIVNFDSMTLQGNSIATNAAGDFVLNIGNSYQSLAKGDLATDSFTYTVADSSGATSTATVSITITGSNDAPEVRADVNAVSEDRVVTASGNVLNNDSDIDAGTALQVAAPGAYAGQFGSIVISADGSYTYTLNNSSAAVQSLAQGVTVTDVFGYSATDGLTSTASTLSISIAGTNDAPIVNIPSADQSAKAGAAFSFQVPQNSFADIDTSDVLTFVATLSSGQPLPAWLQFNPVSRTFTGTPAIGDVGQLSISILATDKFGASASDTFLVNVAAAVIGGGAGCDILRGSESDDDIEGFEGNDLLYGNGGNDRMDGGNGDDSLDGGKGADSMCGGAGNDTYYVDSSNDIILEKMSEGNDTVKASVTCTLAANVENLTLTGTAAINGTGNELDNVITGNSGINALTGGAGNDTLNGGAGADKLFGGQGNDAYVVDNVGDVVTENLNEGTDTVQSSVTYTLGANVENLTLTGTTKINGTGNTLNNVLTGNSASNTLNGGAGNDTFNGGAGADILMGGTGNDVYQLGMGAGSDTIQENDATAGNTDVAQFYTGVATDQLWFSKSGNNLVVNVIGTSDAFTVSNWYLGSEYHVEQFKTADGKTLLDSQVQNLVSAMAGFAPPAAGQTTLPANYAAALQPVIAANWQ